MIINIIISKHRILFLSFSLALLWLWGAARVGVSQHSSKAVYANTQGDSFALKPIFPLNCTPACDAKQVSWTAGAARARSNLHRTGQRIRLARSKSGNRCVVPAVYSFYTRIHTTRYSLKVYVLFAPRPVTFCHDHQHFAIYKFFCCLN
jgi:hypothetical protein